MKLPVETPRYNLLSIGLHWGMLLLLVAVYASMELSGSFPRGSETREALRTWHYMLGMSVFFLAWLRLAVNLATRAPRIEPEPPVWQNRLAGLVQAMLYVLMVGMPFAGWLVLSAKGQPVPFFGMHLPPLMAQNKNAADLIKDIHEAGATAGYFLVGLHAAAALFHHYVVHDNTLQRMLRRRS